MAGYEFTWGDCPQHEWSDIEDPIADGEVRCTRCGMPGQRLENDEVYFPAS